MAGLPDAAVLAAARGSRNVVSASRSSSSPPLVAMTFWGERRAG